MAQGSNWWTQPWASGWGGTGAFWPVPGKGQSMEGPPQGKGLSPGPVQWGHTQSKGPGQEGWEVKGKGEGVLPQGKGLSPGPEEVGHHPFPEPCQEGKGEGQGPSPGPPRGKGKDKASQAEANKHKKQSKAQKQKLADRSNTLSQGQYRMPWYHRRKKHSPKECRHNVEHMIPLWKNKTIEDGAEFKKAKGAGTVGSWAEPNDLTKLRRMVEEIFGQVGVQDPRILRDVQTPAGNKALMEFHMWPDGPKWKDFLGDAKPDLPQDDVRSWDFWATDYHPCFWPHVFKGGEGLYPNPGSSGSGDKGSGKGLSPSQLSPPDHPGSSGSGDKGSGKGLSPSQLSPPDHDPWMGPPSSWLSYHGTNIYGAMTAIGMNALAKSESLAGRATPGDVTATPGNADLAAKFGFETAVGRGIYSAQDWSKASAYALPTFWAGNTQCVYFVLLLRIPGREQEIGVTIQLGEAGSKAQGPLYQLSGGQAFKSLDKWPLIPASKYQEALGKEKGMKREDVQQNGFWRTLRSQGETFSPTAVVNAVRQNALEIDPELNKRKSRHMMQDEAEKTHTGESKWTNVDHWGVECISSHCSIVGFFVGYGPTRKAHVTTSRQAFACKGLQWDLLPPLCRPDNVLEKNAWVAAERAKLQGTTQPAAQPPPQPPTQPGAASSSGCQPTQPRSPSPVASEVDWG